MASRAKPSGGWRQRVRRTGVLEFVATLFRRVAPAAADVPGGAPCTTELPLLMVWNLSAMAEWQGSTEAGRKEALSEELGHTVFEAQSKRRGRPARSRTILLLHNGTPLVSGRFRTGKYLVCCIFRLVNPLERGNLQGLYYYTLQ